MVSLVRGMRLQHSIAGRGKDWRVKGDVWRWQRRMSFVVETRGRWWRSSKLLGNQRKVPL